MENLKYKFVVIGAGVSGLSTAYELSKTYPNDVFVLEKDCKVGGLCKTINRNNAFYDLGSHRIHKDSGEEAFELIKNISGEALIKNVRGGKLMLKNLYINYPITSAQIIFGIGLIESFLCTVSLFKYRIFDKLISNNMGGGDLDYESYLIKKVGQRAYKLFYEPYARKVWGQEPSLISITAVKKRISMLKPTSFLQNIIVNYFRKKEKNYYYYLENGFECFSDNLEKRIIENSCKVLKNVSDFSINVKNGKKMLGFLNGKNEIQVEFEKLISTIPIDELVLKLNPDNNMRMAINKIKWRGLRLVYLHIKGEPKIEGETFYFSELKYLFGRVSIQKRFSRKMQPDNNYTSFTCEVPCSEDDGIWNKADKEMYDLCFEGLQEAGLITKKQDYLLGKNFIIDISKVYPVYSLGWESILLYLLGHMAENFPYIYISGRPGLFLHCNLDHSIDIGLFLAEHIREGKLPKQWYEKISLFHDMIVRD